MCTAITLPGRPMNGFGSCVMASSRSTAGYIGNHIRSPRPCREGLSDSSPSRWSRDLASQPIQAEGAPQRRRRAEGVESGLVLLAQEGVYGGQTVVARRHFDRERVGTRGNQIEQRGVLGHGFRGAAWDEAERGFSDGAESHPVAVHE